MDSTEKEKQVRFTLDMDEKLHREFKICAVGQGVSMRDLALRFLRDGIDQINATAKKRAK